MTVTISTDGIKALLIGQMAEEQRIMAMREQAVIYAKRELERVCRLYAASSARYAEIEKELLHEGV